MSLTVDDLFDEFDELPDWEDRYGYIIELGEDLPELPAEHKVEANRVQGCQSNVWLIPRPKPAHNGHEAQFEFLADSDSQIVRGLIAILMAAYSGKTPREVAAFDVNGLFTRIGLRQNLSPSRSNGFHSMVKRIQTLAQQAGDS